MSDHTIVIIWVMKIFFVQFFCVFLPPLLNIFCFVMSMPFLSFIKHIFAWNVLLVSLIFLKRSLAFPILLFSSVSLHWSLRKEEQLSPAVSLMVFWQNFEPVSTGLGRKPWSLLKEESPSPLFQLKRQSFLQCHAWTCLLLSLTFSRKGLLPPKPVSQGFLSNFCSILCWVRLNHFLAGMYLERGPFLSFLHPLGVPCLHHLDPPA